ncbi:calcium/proton exchanger [Saccharococcus caldoxylosilyticus]|uniref:Ca(2+)/H(+) antiporter n=1 Tax=Parageobacillus caldoxylosilyticus NBRC 107762 TaxID=1220594 RepID=A0A023DIT0_9BACL|nr:calcium/proton exchanger [Parageobacillus caldoxylosilyticus]OQP03019.1 calcium/proton exchanger [Geobacillus sp. 44B]MBB3852062.1 Ca2+:H+ antiporter [Parageobacillus caldoxylosilyticus]QNU38361.1 calcium/proton exchanger [Geobacillus sp. 44B]QXJ38027.1 Putative cation exchanger YfkE [Parageobacillus caldoxylosilyticus]BDG34496.1 calcium/proton exchanger [Parageobacillus caldoxylosilyticus]
MNKVFTWMAWIGVPLSVIGSVFHWSALLMFVIYCLTIIALASYMGRATESLAIVAGPRIGGLLNATFGNAVELIISIFALKAGLVEVVLASLTGSVLGNLLLVAGLSFFVGGLKYKRQEFNVYDARHNAGLLTFAILVAFVIPEVFTMDMSDQDKLALSVGISIIMIILYLAALYFRLVTHRGVYQQKSEIIEEHEKPEWTKGKSILILALATIAVAYISERLVHTFETVAESFGWSELFIGIIIVAIVGNAAEHASAVIMAYKNKMNVAVEIAVGSTLQIAMFVAPVLVLVSLLFPEKMPLVFSLPELIAMVVSVLLTIVLSNDGDTNWFEGATLLAAYTIMGIGFYLL